MKSRFILSSTILAVMLIKTIAPAANAEEGMRGHHAGTVTACSDFGTKCIPARVRDTPLGPQYLSRGGAWTWCEYTCEDTLRRATVDFWADQEGVTGPEPSPLFRRLLE
jgi:hypothetical protein